MYKLSSQFNQLCSLSFLSIPDFDRLYKVTENVTVSVSYILRSGLRHKGFRIFMIAQPEREPNVLFDH